MSENKHYTYFINWLNQGQYYHGTRLISPGESFFCEYNPVEKDELQQFEAKLIDSYAAEDEWSGPMGYIWEFIFPAYKSWFYGNGREIPEKKVLIEFYGHYRSHEGSEYSGWKEVKPKTVTKTVYE